MIFLTAEIPPRPNGLRRTSPLDTIATLLQMPPALRASCGGDHAPTTTRWASTPQAQQSDAASSPEHRSQATLERSACASQQLMLTVCRSRGAPCAADEPQQPAMPQSPFTAHVAVRRRAARTLTAQRAAVIPAAAGVSEHVGSLIGTPILAYLAGLESFSPPNARISMAPKVVTVTCGVGIRTWTAHPCDPYGPSTGDCCGQTFQKQPGG